MRAALLALALVVGAAAWDDGDLEVFDAVEEVNQNFYQLLGVQHDATPQEIKSAFKKLTLKLHPDKNNSPDADIQFRNLVSVHNVLKDAVKREKYNEVLKNGLPNWRSAIYYYRHVRKMGLVEGAIILFIIITFGQYAVSWAAYLEKRYTAEQILNSRGKKHQKKSAFEAGVAEILDQLPRPSVKDTLPFQIPRWIFWSIVATPGTILAIIQHYKDKKAEKIRQAQWEEEERLREERDAAEAEAAKAARAGGPRKRRGFVPPERGCLLDPVEEPAPKDDRSLHIEQKPALIAGGLWTDDDLAELVRLVKKHPGGTSDRWEKIAETMCRSVQEVTHMAAKLKDNCYKLPEQDVTEAAPPEPPKKMKTRKTDAVPSESQANWLQAQQKALEAALAKFPKSGAGDRWEKIAKCVPDKTKEECMLRCKYLADLVKKQRQKEEEELRQQQASAGENLDTGPDVPENT